ncbi:MAG: TIGR03617 family F420-dependent LLM class oxidoreductase [Mycobacterium sp.]
MLVDGTIGGTAEGGDIGAIVHQLANADRMGYAGVWSTEVARDPFLPLLLAAEHTPRLTVGTAIAVAFARNPMSMATVANDLQSLSSGKFMLGLGSQIKAHIERRFSMPWSRPADRMREFVAAMHVIWDSWHNDQPLDFRGDFYEHTLMPPAFRPCPNVFGAPPVLIAAVGPQMTTVAAEVADGLIVHGFTTERFLREVTVPQVNSVLERERRSDTDFMLAYSGFVVTGLDERALAEAAAAVRRVIAFYGSTPAYRGVLDLHGWGDLHTELHRLSKINAWDTMTGLIDDTMLNTFAVVGEPKKVGAEVRRRFGDIVDRFSFYAPYQLHPQACESMISAIRTGPIGTVRPSGH